MLLSSDSSVGIAKSVGLGVISFSDAISTLSPDILVLLGDRFEILAAAQAAMIMNIPIAHISGGEITEGAIDDRIRHAITKMADFHFVASEIYRRRVIQMGEQPEQVINCGDPGLDNFRRLQLLTRDELEKALNFHLGTPTFLVTYHPVTSGVTNPQKEMQELLNALDQFPSAQIIMTKPNADVGGRIISKMVDEYSRKNSGSVHMSVSLGQLRYLSAMKHSDVVIGNSSSGIVEAPAIKKPTVNIGKRQTGRLKAQSIIDCDANEESIVNGIKKAISNEFKHTLAGTHSLYGDCNASSQIKEYLKQVHCGREMSKIFFDLDVKLN